MGESQLGGLLQPRFGLPDHAHLAGQPDLAEHHGIIGCRQVARRRDQGTGHRQIARRLGDPEPAGDVEIDVLARQGEPAAGLQHRQHHGEPAGIPAHYGAARGGQGRRRHQRLDLDQQRAAALDAGEYRRTGNLAPPLREEQCGGVFDLDQAAIGHLEHADLVGRPEPVLDRAQHAELMAALALEIKHRVDHVLEHTRARDGAVLGDVADENHAEPAALGEADQLLGAGADLGHRAGRRFQRIHEHGLDGIDHHHAGRRARLQGRHDVAHAGRGGQPDRRLAQPQPVRPQAHLVDRFLAGDVGASGLRGEPAGDL